uniref:Uncharacterized protein n=1 Tax=Thermosporothrix sp. COM3 TaxID=2490863 RepID=A0A455SWY9_9CHLR|nr:hypothetical protein KTC_53160 [Thermosporothrix sp. COM3]
MQKYQGTVFLTGYIVAQLGAFFTLLVFFAFPYLTIGGSATGNESVTLMLSQAPLSGRLLLIPILFVMLTCALPLLSSGKLHYWPLWIICIIIGSIAGLLLFLAELVGALAMAFTPLPGLTATIGPGTWSGVLGEIVIFAGAIIALFQRLRMRFLAKAAQAAPPFPPQPFYREYTSVPQARPEEQPEHPSTPAEKQDW